MSTVMTLEQFLLLTVALIYIAISYGHSPGEPSADSQDDMHPEGLDEK